MHLLELMKIRQLKNSTEYTNNEYEIINVVHPAFGAIKCVIWTLLGI